MIHVRNFEFNMLPVNTYVVWDDSLEAAIIDPGCMWPGESDELFKFISDQGLNVKLLLNTHLHFDHIFGNPDVEEKYGLRAKANDADMIWLTDIKRRASVFGIRYEKEVAPILPENVLHDGDTVRFGNVELKVLHVPGHSPGSVAFYCADGGMLFTGDIMFQGGMGRTDFPDGSYESLVKGVREKLLVLPDDTTVWPGHGPATTIGAEKWGLWS